ncbi:MAG: undecaprenyl-phosphate glucose phosphotransferase [Betaproteobacteria bacterium]|nr:undecaprenyl-phosphate glucose phosphotransferase [Betaproteobacteria bacterium]
MANSGRSVLQRRSSVSNIVQAALDGLAVILTAVLLVQARVGFVDAKSTIMILLLMGIMAVVYDQLGVYRAHGGFTVKAMTLIRAWTVTFAAMLLIAFLAKQSATYSRIVIAALYAIGLLVQIILHWLIRSIQLTWVRDPANREKVLIVGQGELAESLRRKISSNPWLAQEVIGQVAVDRRGAGSRAPEGPALGNLDDVSRLIHEHDIRAVYIVTPLASSEVLEGIYFALLDENVAIHWIPDIFSLRLINYHVKELAGIPLMTLSETPLVGTRLFLKTLEDRVLGLMILLCISPVLLVIAVAVKLDSAGPVFFRQDRAGWNGRHFRIWKFRSMYVHLPDDGVIEQARRNDSRITRVGALLRRTSLDELPQLFNVLAGDMSLVGPRPHATQHDQEYSKRIADYFARHNIKPGMTGLAQVRGFRGETRNIELMTQRVDSDIEYINNWSVWLDLVIILRTFGAFKGKNAY